MEGRPKSRSHAARNPSDRHQQGTPSERVARGVSAPRPRHAIGWRPHRDRRAVKRRSLLAQVLAVNAVPVAGALVVAVLSTGRSAGHWHDVVVFGAALLASLAGNWLLLRRRFEPLDALVSDMAKVDPGRPDTRVARRQGGSSEVERLTAAFDGMLRSLAHERRGAGLAAVRAQERERQRIAQDLHDEVNQALTAILLRLEASLLRAPPALRPELGEIKRLTTRAMEELLQMARRLRPAVLDDHGLVAALRAQVEEFGRQSGLVARFAVHGAPPPLSPEQTLAVYRVTQESLSNVAQHAGAGRVDVELSFVGWPTLTVTDDGRGFTGPRDGGLGLSGMRERARLAAGRLTIASEPGHGTRIELAIAHEPPPPPPDATAAVPPPPVAGVPA
jgi:two-component system, NarL family, sensor histidine kinase UhpB